MSSPATPRHVRPNKKNRPPAPAAADASIAQPAQPAPRPDAFVVLRVAVGFRAVGHVIGVGGQTIQAIRARSGATVEIDALTPDVLERRRIVTIEGGLEQAKRAVQLVVHQLATRQTARSGAAPVADAATPRVSLALLLPNWQLGGILGRNGATLHETRQLTGATITPSADPGAPQLEREVHVLGAETNVTQAADILIEQLCRMQATRAGVITAVPAVRLAVAPAPAPVAAMPAVPYAPQIYPAPQGGLPQSFEFLHAQMASVTTQLQQLGMQAAHVAMYSDPDGQALQACRYQIEQLQHIYMTLQAQAQLQHQEFFAPQLPIVPISQFQPPPLPLPPPSRPLLSAVASGARRGRGRLPPTYGGETSTGNPPLRLQIPSHLIGHVIGPRGSTIQRIRLESQAAIEIAPEQPAPVAEIFQHRETSFRVVEHEDEEEEAKCDDDNGSGDDSKQDEADSPSPPSVAPSSMRDETGTDTETRLLVISGTNEQIEKAAQLIAAITQAKQLSATVRPRRNQQQPKPKQAKQVD